MNLIEYCGKNVIVRDIDDKDWKGFVSGDTECIFVLERVLLDIIGLTLSKYGRHCRPM